VAEGVRPQRAAWGGADTIKLWLADPGKALVLSCVVVLRDRRRGMTDRTKCWRPKSSELALAVTLILEFEKSGNAGAYTTKLRECVDELKRQGVPILGWIETGVCRTCFGSGQIPDPERWRGDLWASKTCPICRGAGRPEHLFPEQMSGGENG
jgi:hypothetical protein